MVVDAFALEHRVPRGTSHNFAAVFVPFDVELGLFVVAQDFGGTNLACTLF